MFRAIASFIVLFFLVVATNADSRSLIVQVISAESDQGLDAKLTFFEEARSITRMSTGTYRVDFGDSDIGELMVIVAPDRQGFRQRQITKRFYGYTSLEIPQSIRIYVATDRPQIPTMRFLRHIDRGAGPGVDRSLVKLHSVRSNADPVRDPEYRARLYDAVAAVSYSACVNQHLDTCEEAKDYFGRLLTMRDDEELSSVVRKLRIQNPKENLDKLSIHDFKMSYRRAIWSYDSKRFKDAKERFSNLIADLADRCNDEPECMSKPISGINLAALEADVCSCQQRLGEVAFCPPRKGGRVDSRGVRNHAMIAPFDG